MLPAQSSDGKWIAARLPSMITRLPRRIPDQLVGRGAEFDQPPRDPTPYGAPHRLRLRVGLADLVLDQVEEEIGDVVDHLQLGLG